MLKIEYIKLYLSTWQYNAGLVGIANILQHAGEEINIQNQYVELRIDQLSNFAEKYFKYMIDTYEKNISWNRIISYEETIEFHENSDYENFTEESLDGLNKYITDILKYYLKSNSYKAAYQLIEGDIDLIELEKSISPVRLKKKENVKDKIDEIKGQMSLIKRAILFLKRDEAKKYVAGKNVIYTFVKNAWDGVCFLNPQTKEKNFYYDYENYFLTPVHEYLQENKDKHKYNCFNCDSKIKDLSNDMGFLKETGFDVNRKASHVWDFANDIAICNICKLVYSCMPAGFTYVYDKGIFVNDNTSVRHILKVNNGIKGEVLGKNSQERRALTYRGFIKSLNAQWEGTARYEFADVQVVRYEKEKYKFNILSKSMLNIVHDSREFLEKLSNAGYREDSEYVSIYENTVDRILNNQNLFTLIHKAVLYSITSPKDTYCNTAQLVMLMKINMNIIKGMGHMKNIEEKRIDDARIHGFWLKQEYVDKSSKEKVNSVSYRLLNALKTANENMFMDTLINCYLYVKKPVPKIFIDCLKDEDIFKTIGYAFVAGLTSEKNDLKEIKKGE